MTISDKMIRWYQKHKRHLPFRETKNPYLIWLSEIIMQQTRIEQGLPYYYRFTEQYPELKQLAQSSEKEVLKLWQGLGYYSRGRNLLETAKHIQFNLNGKFPETYDALLQLKGIGSYTAAAIASFAFNQPAFVVDGNVARVISRLFAVEEPVNSSSGKKIIQQIANQIGNPKRAALHNYAIMELGALLCTPRQPLCPSCPLQEHCVAYLKKQTLHYPQKTKKLTVKLRYFYYLVLISQQHVYIQQRSHQGIWKNLYDFPVVESNHKLSDAAIEKFVNDYGVKQYKHSKIYLHKLTHQHIRAVFMIAKAPAKNRLKKHPELINVTINNFKLNYAHSRLIELFIQDYFNS
jgi:A/G-specific adenine glycosylase